MHHFVTEMCVRVHIFVTKWCIVGYGTGALWKLCNRSVSHSSVSPVYMRGSKLVIFVPTNGLAINVAMFLRG